MELIIAQKELFETIDFIDPKTRIKLANHNGLLKLGMFADGVMAATLSSPEKSILIPYTGAAYIVKKKTERR